jgi:Tol biopolymer transport system component
LLLLLALVAALVLQKLNTPAVIPRSWVAPSSLPLAGPAAATPRGNLVFDSNRTGNYEIFTMGPNGSAVRRLTNDRVYDTWWPQVSPNGRTILFYRTPKGVHDRDHSKTSLWAMSATGADPVELRPAGLDGWVFQGHAEWSPNGRQIVMFGGSRFNPQIWVTDSLGRHPSQVTDRGGTNLDPSWSPDGRNIVFVGCPQSFCTPGGQEVYTVPATGGTPVRITDDGFADYDPTFSHNGAELAWLTNMSSSPGPVGTWDIRTIPVVRVGRNGVTAAPGVKPRLLLPDISGVVNSKPSWSQDDTTIYFHRGYGNLAGGFQIWAVNADGSHLRKVTAGQPGSNEYPSA